MSPHCAPMTNEINTNAPIEYPMYVFEPGYMRHSYTYVLFEPIWAVYVLVSNWIPICYVCCWLFLFDVIMPCRSSDFMQLYNKVGAKLKSIIQNLIFALTIGGTNRGNGKITFNGGGQRIKLESNEKQQTIDMRIDSSSKWYRWDGKFPDGRYQREDQRGLKLPDGCSMARTTQDCLDTLHFHTTCSRTFYSKQIYQM